MHCRVLPTCRAEKIAPDVIMRHAPLTRTTGNIFSDHLVPCPAVTLGGVGHIHPIVDVPLESTGLVLKVTPALAPFVDQFLLIGDAVAVRVSIAVQVKGIRFTNQYPIIDRLDHSRQLQPIHEHRAFVHAAVVIGILKENNTTDRVVLVLAIDFLHVGVQLRHVEFSIAIECNSCWFLHHRFSGHKLDAVALLELHHRHAFFRRIGASFGIIELLIEGFCKKRIA